MADSASLEKTAKLFPHHVGWLCCDRQINTTLTLNGTMIGHSTDCFPLVAQIKIYDQGKVIVQAYSQPIAFNNFVVMDLRSLLNGQELIDGYFELTIFPQELKSGLAPFFTGAWCSVFDQDGKVQINYPLTLSKGSFPPMLDSRSVYYPGLVHDEKFTSKLLIMNPFDFANECDVMIYNADGVRLKKHFVIPAKRAICQSLEAMFSDQDLMTFFQSRPGMLVFYMKYKMNAHIQLMQKQTGVLCGMDHLGLLFAHASLEAEAVSEEGKNVSEQGDLVCICKSLSEKQICGWRDHGMNLQTIQSQSGAGTVCRGCVPELEKICGEKTHTELCQ